MKKEVILEGLDCAHCATKIEEEVNKLHYINSAVLNFITKTLSIEVGDSSKADEAIDATKSIVKKLEPHVEVKEKHNYYKKVFILKNLDCAHCAGEIEKAVSNLNKVKDLIMTRAYQSSDPKWLFIFGNLCKNGEQHFKAWTLENWKIKRFEEDFFPKVSI